MVRMAARFKTKNSITPNEIRNLNGSRFRYSSTVATLLVPGPGDRVYETHDRHDVRQVVAGHDLLQQLHVHRARGPVVDPVGRVRAVGDDVHGVLAACRLYPPDPVALVRADAAPQIRHYLALGQVLEDLLYHADALF